MKVLTIRLWRQTLGNKNTGTQVNKKKKDKDRGAEKKNTYIQTKTERHRHTEWNRIIQETNILQRGRCWRKTFEYIDHWIDVPASKFILHVAVFVEFSISRAESFTAWKIATYNSVRISKLIFYKMKVIISW